MQRAVDGASSKPVHGAGSEPPIRDRWREETDSGATPTQELVHRCHLLGADQEITHHAGGSASVEVDANDPVTRKPVPTLLMTSPGQDLATLSPESLTRVSLDRLRTLLANRDERDPFDEVAERLAHCTLDPDASSPGVDAILHASIPHRHVDHTHPAAVIALTAARGGEALVREALGKDVGWLPWMRPGLKLAGALASLCRSRPDLRGAVLAGHGLLTWGDTARDCYHTTLDLIRRARALIDARDDGSAFGGPRIRSLPLAERREFVARLLPALRGRLARTGPKVAHFDDSPRVREFVDSNRAEELAAAGADRPDHLIGTGVRPLFLDVDAGAREPDRIAAELDERLAEYRAEYAAYRARGRRAADPPHEVAPDPSVILLPGAGLIAFAEDKTRARVATELYRSAIEVIRGAALVGGYTPRPEREILEIEASPHERKPPSPIHGDLEGRIALVTGGAGEIGRATSALLLEEGACVMLMDVDDDTLRRTGYELVGRFGVDRVRTSVGDVSSEEDVRRAIADTARLFGGLDVLIACAGVHGTKPLDQTSLDAWQRSLDVLATGSFLVSREALKLMKTQGLGGSLVFVASRRQREGAPPPGAAHDVARSAERHLVRCLANEGAEAHVRANVVDPFFGPAAESVRPEDVARATLYFASDRSRRSTGSVLQVSGDSRPAEGAETLSDDQ